MILNLNHFSLVSARIESSVFKTQIPLTNLPHPISIVEGYLLYPFSFCLHLCPIRITSSDDDGYFNKMLIDWFVILSISVQQDV